MGDIKMGTSEELSCPWEDQQSRNPSDYVSFIPNQVATTEDQTVSLKPSGSETSPFAFLRELDNKKRMGFIRQGANPPESCSLTDLESLRI